MSKEYRRYKRRFHPEAKSDDTGGDAEASLIMHRTSIGASILIPGLTNAIVEYLPGDGIKDLLGDFANGAEYSFAGLMAGKLLYQAARRALGIKHNPPLELIIMLGCSFVGYVVSRPSVVEAVKQIYSSLQ